VLRGAAYGGWGGAIAAALVIAASRLWWFDLLPPAWVAGLALFAIASGVGAIVGALRPILAERELALLVDRALGTDEVLVTLLHLESTSGASAGVRADLERRVADLPPDPTGVASGPPRHARWLPIAALVAALLLLIPARPPIGVPATVLAAEAQRLAEALQATPDLPPEIKQAAADLLKDLQAGALTDEEAAQRLRDLQDALKKFDASMADSQADLAAIDEAARALSEPALAEPLDAAAGALADALERQDLAEAGRAADALADALSQASADDRQSAGEALQQAGEALSNASSPQLKRAAEALKQAGDELQKSTGQPGTGADGAAEKALRDLKDKLGDGRELAEKLSQDRERMRQSQEANGALEASRQRLGGEPDAPAGQASGSGTGAPGTGMDAGIGPGEGPTNAGRGHTWEDEGTFDTVGGHQDSDRTSDRASGKVADDFEAFYDPQRLEGAEGLVVSVDGMIDDSGHFDTIERRLTGSDEKAKRALVDVPDVYREAAERALTDDRVPPGYRAAIKDYFDTME
jgi:hypothetical protein